MDPSCFTLHLIRLQYYSSHPVFYIRNWEVPGHSWQVHIATSPELCKCLFLPWCWVKAGMGRGFSKSTLLFLFNHAQIPLVLAKVCHGWPHLLWCKKCYLLKWKIATNSFGLHPKQIKASVDHSAIVQILKDQHSSCVSTFAMNGPGLSQFLSS